MPIHYKTQYFVRIHLLDVEGETGPFDDEQSALEELCEMAGWKTCFQMPIQTSRDLTDAYFRCYLSEPDTTAPGYAEDLGGPVMIQRNVIDEDR